MRIHGDDRRLGYFGIFPLAEGDVNVVHVYSGSLCAWHRHQHQDDDFFVVRGALKFGIIDEHGTGSWCVLDERNPGPLHVPRNHWHGYHAFAGAATYVMWASRKYDGTDEERKGVGEMPVEWLRTSR